MPIEEDDERIAPGVAESARLQKHFSTLTNKVRRALQRNTGSTLNRAMPMRFKKNYIDK